ncbi:hypothetical protein DQ04_07661020, partial [Trypanosoma grayi]|uniref:hypothetical protein n=1 Tax=Trypanosoma grayi TaxID=71804 RepID=UPI0004F411C4
MQQWTRRLHAVNKSAGRRWSPIPQPPPPHVDRLCGTHSVLNTLRAFYNSPQQQHPHRKQLRRLFVRDFRLAFDRPGDAHREDGDGSSNPNENNTSNAISGGSC